MPLKNLITIGIAVLVANCSLLFGPLSQLSLEALTSGEWKWEWVGEWQDEILPIPSLRTIKIYKLKSSTKPSFLISYGAQANQGKYLHIKETKEKETIMEYNNTSFVPCPNPIFVYISPNEEDCIICGVNITNETGNGGVFSYHIQKGEKKTIPLGVALQHIALLNNALLFRPEAANILRWPIHTDVLPEVFLSAANASPYDFFTLSSHDKTKNLFGFISNDSGKYHYHFHDETGAQKPEMYFSRPAMGGMLSYHCCGVIGKKYPHVLVIENSLSNYILMSYVNNKWATVTSHQVVEAANQLFAVDILAIENIILVGWLIEPQTILIESYKETDKGLEKLSSRTLSCKDKGKGDIEGINFFYDKWNGNIYLALLHRFPGDNHIGISYFWTP